MKPEKMSNADLAEHVQSVGTSSRTDKYILFEAARRLRKQSTLMGYPVQMVSTEEYELAKLVDTAKELIDWIAERPQMMNFVGLKDRVGSVQRALDSFLIDRARKEAGR